VLEYNLGKFFVQVIGIRTLRFVSSEFALIWRAHLAGSHTRGIWTALRGCFLFDPSLLIYLPPLVLDTGSQLTAQAYDISNVQGFTQSVSIGADGCESTTCQAVNCPCTQAYPPGVSTHNTHPQASIPFWFLAECSPPSISKDTSGCGNGSPVRARGAGNIGFKGLHSLSFSFPTT